MAVLFGIPDWVVLILTLAVLLYFRVSRYKNHWKKQNVPHESYALIFGPMLRITRKPFHELDLERYKKYGRVYGMFESGKPSLFVAEPELLKQILLKDFLVLPNRRSVNFFEPLFDYMLSVIPYPRWKTIRKYYSPAFTSGKLRKMEHQIEACTKSTMYHLQKAAEEERDLELGHFFGNFTLDLIARYAFGTHLDSHSDQTNDFVTYAKKVFGKDFSVSLIVHFLLPGVAKFFRLKFFNPDTLEYFRSLCQRVIKGRIDTKIRQDDFLQHMIDCQQGTCSGDTSKEVADTEERIFDVDSKLADTEDVPSNALSEEEAMAQCFMFLIAGQGTTSTLVAFTLYMLALNPDVQEKLREEVDLCVKNHGEYPAMEVVAKLEYLHGVISEMLRMFPPASRLERETTQDYVLGDTGIKIPKGCVIAVPLYAMHHDPEYFPDPFVFRPERFMGENATNIRPYTYLPFGAGPRNCVGMRLGLHAAKMAVLHAVRIAQFVRTDKTKVPLEFFKGFGVISSSDITVGVRKRAATSK
ncbi:cytochrome P450 3A8-like [Dermacentor andersoni]|uniref:cytochrome P450 3A8-like n=1 Tax=Dermacentor andersoni TaxID=34620 RepID=UPI003B3B5974